MENDLNLFASRAGFNTALRHFKSVNNFVADINEGYNLADVISESLDDGEIQEHQVKSIISALLTEKFPYQFSSYNIEAGIESVDSILTIIQEWSKIHLVVAYSNPQAGLQVINPKQDDAWEEVVPLQKDELIVIYAGSIFDDLEDRVLNNAIKDFIGLLNGRRIKSRKEFIGNKTAPQVEKTPEPPKIESPVPDAKKETPPASGGKRRVTPRYSVLVTNELFHNGNVEAWKKIILSFNTKYPDLDVMIWYDNERINDINALFKWGKVKHGNPILFGVAGENIRDVSKLQRYLFEGASSRFEVFLRGGVDKVLDLF
jgi:hypothetical protein